MSEVLENGNHVRTYDVHDSDCTVIGEVEECQCSHGTAPSHFVARVFKDADGMESYEVGVYDELDDAEMAVADEYDGLGPFDKEDEAAVGYTWEV